MLRPLLSLRAFAAALLAAGLSLAACSWSVPADPGLNAAQRGGGFGPEAFATAPDGAGGAHVVGPTDQGARQLYLTSCTKCHEPFSPRYASAEEWPALVRHYGPRAGLFGADRERVTRWLQANSR